MTQREAKKFQGKRAALEKFRPFLGRPRLRPLSSAVLRPGQPQPGRLTRKLVQHRDLTKLPGDTLADRKVLVKAYLKKSSFGEPLNPYPMYEYTWPPKYNGLEFQWNEPVTDLFEAGGIDRLSAEIRKHPQEFPAVFSAKTKKWRDFYIHFRKLLSLPGVRSVIYQMRSVCLEAEV